MSYQVVHKIRSRKVGSPTRKCILLIMADVANHDGSEIYLSTQTIADETEVSQRTVKRQLKDMVDEGILIKMGKKPCLGGYTINYKIDLSAISELPISGDNLSKDTEISGDNLASGGVTQDAGGVSESAKKYASSDTLTIQEQSIINNPINKREKLKVDFSKLIDTLGGLLPPEKQSPLSDKGYFRKACERYDTESVIFAVRAFYASSGIKGRENKYIPALAKVLTEGKYIPFLASPAPDGPKIIQARNVTEARARAEAFISGSWKLEWGSGPCPVTRACIDQMETTA